MLDNYYVLGDLEAHMKEAETNYGYKKGMEGIIFPEKNGKVSKYYRLDKLTDFSKNRVIFVADIEKKKQILELLFSSNLTQTIEDGYGFKFVVPTDVIYDQKLETICGFHMDEVTGFTLRALIDKKQVQDINLSLEKTLGLVISMGIGLEYLHRKGIFIGDFNQKNVMISKNKKYAYFIDMDSIGNEDVCIANFVEEFLDPQAIHVDGQEIQVITSFRSDLYAYAIHAFYLLTFYHPFNGNYMDNGKRMTIPERMYRRISILGDHQVKYPTNFVRLDFMSDELKEAFLDIFERGKRYNIFPVLMKEYERITGKEYKYRSDFDIESNEILVDSISKVEETIESSKPLIDTKEKLLNILDNGLRVTQLVKVEDLSNYKLVTFLSDYVVRIKETPSINGIAKDITKVYFLNGEKVEELTFDIDKVYPINKYSFYFSVQNKLYFYISGSEPKFISEFAIKCQLVGNDIVYLNEKKEFEIYAYNSQVKSKFEFEHLDEIKTQSLVDFYITKSGRKVFLLKEWFSTKITWITKEGKIFTAKVPFDKKDVHIFYDDMEKTFLIISGKSSYFIEKDSIKVNLESATFNVEKIGYMKNSIFYIKDKTLHSYNVALNTDKVILSDINLSEIQKIIIVDGGIKLIDFNQILTIIMEG